MSSNLDAFVHSSRPTPQPLAVSQEIRDRGSTFLGHIFRATGPEEARRVVTYVRNVLHASRRATHEISAWRCMAIKPGQSGLGGPGDFELRHGSDDDDEKFAGERVLRTMKAEGVMDAVVIISRWYGGELLGPVRFSHIETCTREVCRTFRQTEDMEDCVTTLASLDDILAALRAELAELSLANPTPSGSSNLQVNIVHTTQGTSFPRKAQDYASLRNSLDLKKAKRLVTARENSIRAVKASLKKLQGRQDIQTDEQTHMGGSGASKTVT